MAMRKTGKLPTRTTKPGKGAAQKQAPVVGYGLHGGAFHDPAKFKASKAGHKAGGHMPLGGGNQQSHAPMPGHPSQHPTSYHGPSTTGTIKPGAIRAPRMK